MVEVIFFYTCSEGWFIPDWSRAPNPQLVLDGVEDLVDKEPQQREILFHRLVSSKWVWRKDGERLSLEDKLPPVSILGVGGGFIGRLRLSSNVTVLRGRLKEVFIASSSWL